jgi:hypothetical protein
MVKLKVTGRFGLYQNLCYIYNKNKIMDAKTRMKLIDELMTVVQVMDELYRYHPDNPKQTDVVSEFKKLALRKVELESILDAQV